MRTLEELFRNNNLSDPDDIDALLEVAEITRYLVREELCPDISRLINYTLRTVILKLSPGSWRFCRKSWKTRKTTG